MRDDWDGVPDAPAESGWYWIEDADGLRPLLWRGADWPEPADRGEWQDGVAVLAASDLAGAHFLGRVALPPAVDIRFRTILGLMRKKHVPWNDLLNMRVMIASKPFRST